jgi:hypothetical protein
MIASMIWRAPMAWWVCPLIGVISCHSGDAGHDSDDDGIDYCAEPGSPTTPIDGQGTWFTTATWDMSEGLSDDPLGGLGGAVANGLSTRLAPLVEVPGPLDDDVPGAIRAALAGPVAELVNGRLPTDLRPDGTTIAALRAALGAAVVETTLVVASSGNHSETLRTMTLPDGDGTYEVPLAEIADGSLDGSLSLSEFARALEVRNVEFYVSYPDIVSVIANEMLGVDLSTFDLDIDAAIDCPSIVAELTADSDSFTFELDGETYNVDAADVDTACEQTKAELRTLTLGYLPHNDSAALNGCIDKHDDDGDGVADRLVSRQYYGSKGFGRENVPVSLTAVR